MNHRGHDAWPDWQGRELSDAEWDELERVAREREAERDREEAEAHFAWMVAEAEREYAASVEWDFGDEEEYPVEVDAGMAAHILERVRRQLANESADSGESE